MPPRKRRDLDGSPWDDFESSRNLTPDQQWERLINRSRDRVAELQKDAVRIKKKTMSDARLKTESRLMKDAFRAKEEGRRLPRYQRVAIGEGSKLDRMLSPVLDRGVFPRKQSLSRKERMILGEQKPSTQARVERERRNAREEKRLRDREVNGRRPVKSGMEAVRNSSYPRTAPSTGSQAIRYAGKTAVRALTGVAGAAAGEYLLPEQGDSRRADRAALAFTVKNAGRTVRSKSGGWVKVSAAAAADARRGLKEADSPPPKPVNPMAKYAKSPEAEAIKKRVKGKK